MNKDELFQKTKNEAEEYYKEIDIVHCPYLNTKVKFNALGLDHIKMKAWNKSRSASDQYLRLKFIKLAPEILKNSGTVQEIHETRNFERQKDMGKWKFVMRDVVYYGFVAIIKKIKIKVIVKRVENSQPYFWSIIPFWKNRKNDLNQKIKKVFHDGDLEND